MQKFFIITAFILLSSAAAAAQSVSEKKQPADIRQADYAGRAITIPAASSAGDKTEKAVARRQTLRVVDGRVLRLGPSSTYLKNGLRRDEVVRLLGKPSSISEREENGRLITTCTFERSEGRVLFAEFENGLLINSRMETAAAAIVP